MAHEPIQRLLVVGTDRLTGGALAARWAERYEVVCCERSSAAGCGDVIADANADVVIYCGPASESSWSPAAATGLKQSEVKNAAAWAAVAGERFVYVGSDAVFTGPYMFHDESCAGECESPEAAVLLAIETAVAKACPEALIVRTHAFATSPNGNGLIEQILEDGEATVGGGGYTTPILAADLADIIERALIEETSGVCHIGGAERVSPHVFAERLLEAFDRPRRGITLLIGEHRSGFAGGDRALVCREAKLQLGISMPLLTEAFARLREEMTQPTRSTLRAAA